MPYVYVIRYITMNKAAHFDESLQELAKFSKVLSHPARLAILKFLAESRTCISGDISDYIPLGRTTVSQHLKELRDIGLIHGDIDGLKINYCLCTPKINSLLSRFAGFFEDIRKTEVICCVDDK
jgi:ArsR family transcriptional regulator, arsenate/arsenite/antimonite-responsive transcriptional repressor